VGRLCFQKKQIANIAEYLKNKYFNGDVEPHELAVTIISMVVAGKITEDDAAFIFSKVFLGNIDGARRALKKAEKVLSDSALNDIIKTVEKRLQK
jgi:hypothetical protein